MRRRMLVVEDHPLVAEYTCALFRDLMADVEVVHAGTAQQALQALTEQSDWFRVWLDVDVPGARGLSLVREVHALGLAGKSAVITANLGLQWQAEVEGLGFLGYVPKAMSVERFRHAIREIIEGRRYFAETQRSERPIRLTRRQIEILNLLPAGGGTKEIAKQLKLTAGTVDNHVAAILFALRARSRTHAVAIGIEHGYIEPSVLTECTSIGGP